MKRAVKITVFSAAAAAALALALFVVIPLASSKTAKARLGEALAGAGISQDQWSAGQVYYVPVFGHVVVKKFALDGVFASDKITLAIKTNRDDVFAGSIDAQGLSYSADNTGITAKSLSVKDFSVDTAAFGARPLESVKKLGRISAKGMTLSEDGQPYFTIGEFNAHVGYAEGKIPLPASVMMKKSTLDCRGMIALSALRPEYRISTLEFKTSPSQGVYRLSFIIDVEDLFTINADLGISLPPEFDGLADYASIHYGEEVQLHSLTLTYRDKSFLDHVFELAGLPGGRAGAADLLSASISTLVEPDDVDVERLVSESAGFFQKPGKLELKTNLESPVSFGEIGRDFSAVNLSLSINGGEPIFNRRPAGGAD